MLPPRGTRARPAFERPRQPVLALREGAVPERGVAQRDRLLQAASHDLRSPLSSIQGWLYVLETHAQNDPAVTRRALDGIKRGVAEELRLVDGLLDGVRLATGTLRLEREPVRLVSLTDATLTQCARAAETRGVRLSARYAATDLQVAGDARRLQQVLQHLLANAIRFSHAGGAVLLELAREGDRAVIRVIDGGEGLSAERLQRVFSEGELPMGLARARALCALHGGSLELRSQGLGSGAVALIHLPLYHADHDS